MVLVVVQRRVVIGGKAVAVPQLHPSRRAVHHILQLIAQFFHLPHVHLSKFKCIHSMSNQNICKSNMMYTHHFFLLRVFDCVQQGLQSVLELQFHDTESQRDKSHMIYLYCK